MFSTYSSPNIFLFMFNQKVIYIVKLFTYKFINSVKMGDTSVLDTFRRIQARKSSYPGRLEYGYNFLTEEKTPQTNITKNKFLRILRQKQASEWMPNYLSKHSKPIEITCYSIYHNHVGLLPNYGGHIPGAKFRYGKTFGQDTIDVKRWLRGDHNPN